MNISKDVLTKVVSLAKTILGGTPVYRLDAYTETEDMLGQNEWWGNTRPEDWRVGAELSLEEYYKYYWGLSGKSPSHNTVLSTSTGWVEVESRTLSTVVSAGKEFCQRVTKDSVTTESEPADVVVERDFFEVFNNDYEVVNAQVVFKDKAKIRKIIDILEESEGLPKGKSMAYYNALGVSIDTAVALAS